MFEVFKEYISSKITISAEDWAKIQSICVEKKLYKRDYLSKEGMIWRYNAFVCSGCLRKYRVDDSGYEHITRFIIDKSWAGDTSSMISGKPAVYNIDAIEDTELLLFHGDHFDEICGQIPGFIALMNNDLKECMSIAEDRVNVVLSYTAEEKYIAFMDEYPGLSNRIPQYMIASYLGITPESLSRIRKQLIKNRISVNYMTGS
jgi:CRP-like cAMP-binding protein